MTYQRALITAHGGPEVIEWREEPLPAPGPGEVLIAHEAVGLNFIDTYRRRGIYPIPLPSGLGIEAAGRIVALGEGVTGHAEGDRVAYIGPGLGAYATHRVMPAAALFPLPDHVSCEVAAAALVKAFTVEALVERCAHVKAGDTVLVHAAAGGVGLLMVQWLTHLGVEVIGTVSSAAKEGLAREAGAAHVIRYDREPVAPRVRDLTSGKGVPVVFDGVGMDTWEASLDSLSPRGLLISYGNASGPVEGIGLGALAAKGSLFVTRPTIFHYYATPEERDLGTSRVYDLLRAGALTVTIGQRYPLLEAAQAHRDFEARVTTGSGVLLP
ncbi:quinone oxidoreductase [Altererythrobacter sp. H2]|uniref:quinone oxidoreductase family protein n=1 Tax=Altererythrobacter sp. H2 TaxID=3108391 RepID=UPI002B4BB8D7|nr:quinone oxidoreductase [Altererythrobacter sp. H2]WRK95023.1 quinone oxidoreductase [Altererythrobacter sp. H2]